MYRDQGRYQGKGDGKEVCDLLVIFEKHVFIFSDKDCVFANTGRIEIDWSRWYRRAVLKSAAQVFGAERWIKSFPENLFIDRECKKPLPVRLPPLQDAVFHRIVVAHDGARVCKAMLGGSGSLMLDSSVVGDGHLTRPFTIGHIDLTKGFVHVFDDTTLEIVMNTLDTITDFTAYLTKKEAFLTGPVFVLAAGEEELLAYYLGKLNRSGEHDFVFPRKLDWVNIPEGLWDRFTSSHERQAQIAHDQISYAWDELIQKFAFHAMTGTQYFTSGQEIRDQEVMFRWMAREPRTRRRMLAAHLRTVLERSVTSNSLWDARVIAATKPDQPFYVFLCMRRPPGVSDEEYRQKRGGLLQDYCHVIKRKWPDATDIIGIATESGHERRRSEDLIYLNASKWRADDEAAAREAQERLGILKKTRMGRGREYEYPVDHLGKPKGDSLPSRNSPCHCGSGKRFRHCHGRRFFPKKPKH